MVKDKTHATYISPRLVPNRSAPNVLSREGTASSNGESPAPAEGVPAESVGGSDMTSLPVGVPAVFTSNGEPTHCTRRAYL